MKNMYKFSIMIFVLFFMNTNLSAQSFGNAIKLNGTSNYITIPNTAHFLESTTFTFECWAKRSVSSIQYGKDRLCMSIGTGGWGVFIEANKVKLSKVGVSDCYSKSSISDTLWHHVAVTHDGTNAKFYIDGNLDTTITYTVTFSGSGSYSIGSRNAGEYFGGMMDEVRIWNKVKTALEISSQRCAPITGTETGLRSYYKMDESSGTTITDATSNANNGTVTNGTNLWVTSTVFCYVGLNNLPRKNEAVKVYPNPVKDLLNIEMNKNTGITNSSSVQLFDILGNLIYSFNTEQKQLLIETKSFVKGIYLLRISNDEIIFVQRVVVE